MLIKTIIDEDFSNYKKPSMFIGTCFCTFKCCIEAGIPVSTCQNHDIYNTPNLEIDPAEIFKRYINNPITTSVVVGGFEPFLQFEEMLDTIRYFREHDCNDDIVIYTGYTEDELEMYIHKLKKYKNIIIKFGRFVPDCEKHYDTILGVELISPNQYARRINEDNN